MNILIRKYTENDEMLMSLHIRDNNVDTEVYPFYVNSEIDQADSNIRASINSLPDLIKKIYDAGKKGEELNLKQESFQV